MRFLLAAAGMDMEQEWLQLGAQPMREACARIGARWLHASWGFRTYTLILV
jgi:hypothetical protein